MRIIELLPDEVEAVELRLTEVPDEELPEIEEPGGLEIMTWLDGLPLRLLLDETVPERLVIDLPIVILLGLLRLEIELPDETVPELLGIDLFTVILLELLRLGADRLEVIVLDCIRLGALLMVVLPELLKLDIDRLELRPAEIELDLLGVGALLTDGLLRTGAGARDGTEGLAACAVWLELPELELFRELLAKRIESVTKKSKIQIINRKPHILAKRDRKTCNLEFSLYVSMTASFLQQQFYKRASALCITGARSGQSNKISAL